MNTFTLNNFTDIANKRQEQSLLISEYSLYDLMMQKARIDYELKLEEFLKNKLLKLGYKFCCKDDFLQFVKSRITRINYEDNRHYFELYLDYVSPENLGIYICSYNTNIRRIEKGYDIFLIGDFIK